MKLLQRRALLLLALGSGLWIAQGLAMAKMVIFSAVQGRVLDNGKPVAGAQIEREFKWAWKDETGTDKATTGAGGEFSLPAIERSSFLGSLLPHEPVIRQSITIRHGGKSYEAWLHNKHSYANNAELGGKPIRLVCRLENPPQRRNDGIYGICEFE
ncbi:DUF6795 domain-containing protein [Rubrivivax sp. RP6-9]|uniref:DUF6795 domain-containing protein n=1 Tax=Rubrivivax sp. RP6-9 TaxID=3415750 RepID=UPI003CC512AD